MDKGAHYYRCDLQVHTPRDTNWTGQECLTDQDRHAYAADLVRACRDRGLQAIAITDHHDMLFASHIRAAAAEETDQEGNDLSPEQRLVVFPGMELTLGVPCQALVIFDADLPDDMFSLAMTALAITPSPKNKATVAPVRRLDAIESLKQLKQKLDEHQYLRNKYIVFPNVGENGQFSLIRTGLAGKYVEMPCVGGYVDGDIGRLKKGTRNIIDGKDREWGHKRIACFQTSDNRREDHSTLGNSTTWIKWAVPTAEALRQACLAQESRVCQEEPSMPAVAIKGISTTNSSFLGPFNLEFNPQYNSLIGGRGTGKSTILEYLRWALCDQPPLDLAESDTPNYEARRSRLIDNTLKPVHATVDVWFEVNGVLHTVRRDSQTGDLSIKIGTDDMRSCSEEDIRRLLPIQAYSQKQLSDVSVRVDELSRFITAPIRAELDEIEQQLHESAGRIREMYAMVQRYRVLSRTLEDRQLAEKSLSEQVDALRARLSGLSREDRILLDQGKSFSDTEHTVESWQNGVKRLEEGADRLRSAIVAHLAEHESPPATPEGEILREAFDEYRTLLSDAKTALDTLVEQAQRIIAAPETDDNNPWRRWMQKLESFKEEYEQAVSRSSVHQERREQLRETEEQLRSHLWGTTRGREELNILTEVEQNYNSERDGWEKLIGQRDDLLDEQCSKLTADSGGTIRAHVKRYANPNDFVDKLKQALSGSRIQGDKLEQLGETISNAETAEDAAKVRRAILADLEKLAEFDAERDGVEHRPESQDLTEFGLTRSNLDGIGRRLGQEDWLALALTPIMSEPVFEYRAREQGYIPFRNASAGQQATALLTTLLNQPGPPLIIDQPEEDLDNPIILEIVERVWEAKKKRQLIFASHNANLVVNGDAELVAWCNYRTAADQSGGIIEGEGAIDVEDTRNAIKQIMEGGEDAFNLRRAKYGF